MADASTKLRYLIGKNCSRLLDAAVTYGAVSLRSRFPVGYHLELDLLRFKRGSMTTIIDVGANKGNTALRFLRFFPDATVHAFEPVPVTCEVLRRRAGFRQRICVQQKALGNQSGMLSIQLHADSERNSLLNACDGAAVGSAQITVTTLDRYAAEQALQKIDLLKIDTEGYELQVLEGAIGLFKSNAITAVYAEVGFAKSDRYKTSFDALDSFLSQQGLQFSGFYQMFRWGPQKKWAGFANGLWLLN